MTRLTLFLLTCALAGSAVWADDARFDFRKKNFDERWFSYNGRGASDCVEPGDDGLRIQFPDGKVPKDPVGIVWNCRVRGDFVATAHYAILNADATPLGSGVEMYLMLANDTKDGIPVLRATKSDEGRIFNCLLLSDDGKKGRKIRGFAQEKMTADSDRGRLRVERKGTDFFASLAEGDSEDFKTVLKIENIDGADVKMIRFAGLSRGAPKAQLGVRLLEFRLQGDLPNLFPKAGENELAVKPVAGAEKPAEKPAAVPPTESGHYTLWIVIALSGVFLFLFLAVIALVGLSRLRGKAPAPPAKGKKSKEPRTK